MQGSIVQQGTFTGVFMQNHIRSCIRDEDPRDALLKYAAVSHEEPLFTGGAYQASDPAIIRQDGSHLTKNSEEASEEDLIKKYYAQL